MNKQGLKYKKQFDKVPIHQIVRLQALIRGFLSRVMVKKIYGFEMSQGLLMRGTVHIEMEPEKLEQ